MMKPINLLPRKPFWEERFVPLFGGLAAAYALSAALLAFGASSADQARIRDEAEIDELLIQMVLLRQERMPAPEALRFEQYRNIVGAVEGQRYDWPSTLRDIAAPLPGAARLANAAYDSAEASVAVVAHFKAMKDVAAYVDALKTSGAFEDVLITALTTETATLAEEAPAAASAADPAAAFQPSDDPLLAELEWIIFREAVLQESGVALPKDSPSAEAPVDERLQGAFTAEEIASAWEAASRYRAAEAPVAAPVEPASVTYYRVELALRAAGIQPSVAAGSGEGVGP
ncbi:hypothetical protein [Paenibacillus sp.]|uniref:hypothetical protein n=1 Tax=Paenibacillus sp. TaxID=58172 RepID=UPI002D328A8B|nr:hypothetical protein [Paenibacillus sp.]HZG88495.1 hypothetical protein [Paenibacillus sp.]